MTLKGKKIMMGSDSMHVTTGYGGVKANIGPFLRDLGMEVMDMGIQNTGNPHFVDGIEKLPNHTNTQFASQSYVQWLQERRPDIAWYIGDPHWVDWFAQMNVEMLQKDNKFYESVFYFPIDTDILPERFKQIIQAFDHKVTFTKFGESVCKAHDIDDVKVIPHGVNTNVFKPLPDEQVEAVKRQNGLGDKFIVGQVNRNNFRKNTPLLMAAFAEFAKDKDDAVLFLHCDPRDQHGFDLMQYVEQFKLDGKVLFNQRVKNAITGVPPEELNLYYNVMDVHASATTGEGWGLTTTEAQSAGTPVIIGDHTTSPELVKNNGWLVPLVGEHDMDSRIFTQQGGQYYRPQFQGFVDALEDAYSDREKLKKKGESASRFVRGQFAWPRVNKGWQNLFEEIL